MALSLLDSAERGDKVHTTSYVSPSAWWFTERGRQYREHNFKLHAEKGVEITRVFLVNSDPRDELLQEMHLQASRGINVGWLQTQAGYEGDMFLIEGKYAAQMILSNDLTEIEGLELMVDEGELRGFLERFQVFERVMHPITASS